jgi:antitoxin ParD1/3/4
MSQKNIELTERAAQLADKLACEWSYYDPPALIEAALECLAHRLTEPEAARQRLRELVQEGVDDIEAGRYRTLESLADVESMMAEIRHRVDVRLGKVPGA